MKSRSNPNNIRRKNTPPRKLDERKHQRFWLWVKKLFQFLFYLSIPLFSFFLLEVLFQRDYHEMDRQIRFLNYYVYLAILLILTGLITRIRLASKIYVVLIYLAALANYLTLNFRSTPLMPWDIKSAGTALSVLDNYSFPFNTKFALVTFGFLLLFILTLFLPKKLQYKKARLPLFVLSILIAISGFLYIVRPETADKYALDETLFNSTYMSRHNGFVLNFLYSIRYLDVEAPDNYSVGKAEEILNENQEDKETHLVDVEEPDVIVVMNEAFSDLRMLYPFEANQEILPFFDSLDEKANVQKGMAFASVIGGNTATSEFEFLTGMSMAFLPSGSMAYQQYIEEDLPSLASLFQGKGYETLAMHPYGEKGWKRNTVYPMLGFERMKFQNDFVNKEKIRNYISDRALYDEILMELNNTDEPQFIFTVSMQNHGGYSEQFENFEAKVKVSAPDTNIGLDSYLSLVQESDRALEDFTKALAEREKPTLLVFFGDHQPNDFATHPLSKHLPEEDRMFSRKKVPYLLWANYPIPNNQGETSSLNFLGSKLLEASGIEAPAWWDLLARVQEEFPSINDSHYLTKNGEVFETANAPLPEILQDYQIVQYNYLFGQKDRLAKLYE